MLTDLDPPPVVAPNTAIALGQVSGPEAAMSSLDELADDPRLLRHRPFHIARAITLDELGRTGEAEEAYAAGLDCPGRPDPDTSLPGSPMFSGDPGRDSWTRDSGVRVRRTPEFDVPQAAKRMIASPDFTEAPASTSTSETVPE
ncbi:hypothetical protein [Brevibacterium linens]|uniref:hypothetical protein n=1 Tax=Brevibacterium linens TaxID=1703 RepID=UPI003F88A6DB